MIAQFTATYIKKGKWYIAFVQEIPGVNTQGKTLLEAKRNLRDALIMVLKAKRSL
jgi:predicted RNase H-like HicB family nuclease